VTAGILGAGSRVDIPAHICVEFAVELSVQGFENTAAGDKVTHRLGQLQRSLQKRTRI